MPSISKIRLTNVIYEEGNKRYNDELFLFDGHNGAILLENGGGKTVLIQTALQAILPHVDLADRKIKNTLVLENAPAHIAIEWITNDNPRQYVVTAVSLYMTKYGVDSLKYVYEYGTNDPNGIESIPFVRDGSAGKRTADRGEMQDYYSMMRDRSFQARTFQTKKEYTSFLEEQYHIISGEWENVAKINSSEGGVEAFFDECKTTNQLFDRLLIPTVEQSISGHDANMFADIFEKQHASFKNYKKLKETIEENQRIQQQLDGYVTTFETYHQKDVDYLESKQYAKGLWQETQKQKHEVDAKLTERMSKLVDWQQRSQWNKRKYASYSIRVEEETLSRLEQDIKEAKAQHANEEDLFLQVEKNYYSLKLADFKHKQKEEEERLTRIEEEMAKLDQSDELFDYENELEEVKRELLGYFIEQIDHAEKRERELNYELNPIQQRLKKLLLDQDQLLRQETKTKTQIAQLNSIIDTRTKDVRELEQQLLANPTQESVEEEMSKWVNRVQFLDEELIRLGQEQKQVGREEGESTERTEQLRDGKAVTESKQQSVRFQLEQIEKAEKYAIQELSQLRPQWATINHLYLTAESVKATIDQQLVKLNKEREDLLYRERLAHRFVDDYQDQGQFFGDSFLAQQLSAWKNQFDLIRTGTEYVEGLTEEERRKKEQYPLWPVTLVTTKQTKPRLLAKLDEVSDRLQYPIVVITLEEALTINDEETYSWISPQHWTDNLDSDAFAKWKEQVQAKATAIKKDREAKEREIKRWNEVQSTILNFLDEHPYESFEELKKNQSQLVKELEQITERIKQEKELQSELKRKRQANQEQVSTSTDEKQGLEKKVENARRYLQYRTEMEHCSKEIEKHKGMLEQLQNENKILKRQVDDMRQKEALIRDQLKDIESNIRHFKDDDLYKELQGLTPIYTGKTKRYLEEKRRDVDMKIRQITQTHGEWLAKKEGVLHLIQSWKERIAELRGEQSELDETVPFDEDIPHRLERLFDEKERRKGEVSSLKELSQKAIRSYDKQSGHVHGMIKHFNEEFPDQEIMLFSTELSDVLLQLEEETKQLNETKTYLDQEKMRFEKEQKEIEEAERGLERHIESHHFTSPDVIAIELTEEEHRQFTYSRKRFVKERIDQLQMKKDLVNETKKQVEGEKRRFREFCHQNITDMKMKKMAVDGIEYKQTYEDVKAFRHNMLTTVERAISYANELIRQSDAELQTFINQIHSHLETIVEELRQIQKKTKVKVDDDWKQIFTFSIPDWEEEEGKSKIRQYVEWILKQLESERFLNEQGEEDDGKVRKEIETWLQTKQLLQQVMNHEGMRVKCRKVTNDNRVTTSSYSWEQSNVWSGGEKWSKNMTLFLGILNYVAEKKQHLETNMKRHRAVILDNPFGKASSDHVLSPVFFIAEQLGFQMIALTAHAEGKFLQDFFPVIYSCRLRQTKKANHKVMTKEKWLHHAYFQDHEPQSLNRLGQSEQMPLFE